MNFSKLLKPLPPAAPNSEELQAASDKRDQTAALLAVMTAKENDAQAHPQ